MTNPNDLFDSFFAVCLIGAAVALVIGLANALVLCLWRTWRWMHDVRADAALREPGGPRPPARSLLNTDFH